MTGGGLLQSAVTFFAQNFALGIVMAAVFFGGILLMSGRIGWPILIGICAGAVVIGNYNSIATTLMTAGGLTGGLAGAP